RADVPAGQLPTTHAEGVLQSLAGAGAVPGERDREVVDAQFGHGILRWFRMRRMGRPEIDRRRMSWGPQTRTSNNGKRKGKTEGGTTPEKEKCEPTYAADSHLFILVGTAGFDAPACGAGGAGRVTHTRLHSRAALRGPWCAQIVRRQIAYVGSDQLRHGLLAGEPVPDFTLPHSKLLSESHFPPGDAP